MRNVTVTILLLLGVGLGPFWSAPPVNPKADDQGAPSLPTDTCQVGLSHSVRPAAGIRPVGEFARIRYVCLFLDWPPVERIRFERPTTQRQTLQAQHVLLRI